MFIRFLIGFLLCWCTHARAFTPSFNFKADPITEDQNRRNAIENHKLEQACKHLDALARRTVGELTHPAVSRIHDVRDHFAAVRRAIDVRCSSLSQVNEEIRLLDDNLSWLKSEIAWVVQHDRNELLLVGFILGAVTCSLLFLSVDLLFTRRRPAHSTSPIPS